MSEQITLDLTPPAITLTDSWAVFSEPQFTPSIKANRYDDKSGNRFYYFMHPEGGVGIASGITTWLSKTMPESTFLTDWKVKMGADWRSILNTYAEYGTNMHICYETIMRTGKPDNMAFEICKSILRSMKLDDKLIDRDCRSFIKFLRDYKVKQLIIEGILIGVAITGDYFAMTIDLLAEMTLEKKTKRMAPTRELYVIGDKKGQMKMKEVTDIEPYQIKGLVDFKSNLLDKDDKSFYDGHKFQLIGAKKAVEQNFGIKVDKLFNFSPLNWRTAPKYVLKEHEITSDDLFEYELYEKLASVKGFFSPSGKFTDYSEVHIDMNLENSIIVEGYKERVERVLAENQGL